MSDQRPDGEQPPSTPPSAPIYPTYPGQQAPPAYPPPQHAQPQYAAPQYGQPQYGMAPTPVGRPGTVTAAAMISIVLAGLGALLFGVLGGFAVSGNEDFVDGFTSEIGTFSDDEARQVVTVIGVVALVFSAWSVVTIVTAALSLGRRNWARIVTVVTSGVWILLGVLSMPGGIFSMAGGVAVVVLYFVGQANAWYSGRPVNPWG